jgi:hypothetical protein
MLNVWHHFLDINSRTQLKPEGSPLPHGRWPNPNTETHYINSQTLTQQIVRTIIDNPDKSLRHVASRIHYLLTPQIAMYQYRPSHWVLPFYGFCVNVSGILLFQFALIVPVLAVVRQSLAVFWFPETVLIYVTLFSIILTAIGDAGEEARFIIQFLPIFVALPAVARRLLFNGDPL